jgi:hypothetical protein
VDVDAGNELVRRIARMTPGIGGFSGLFPLGNALAWHHFIFTNLIIQLFWGKKKQPFSEGSCFLHVPQFATRVGSRQKYVG